MKNFNIKKQEQHSFCVWLPLAAGVDLQAARDGGPGLRVVRAVHQTRDRRGAAGGGPGPHQGRGPPPRGRPRAGLCGAPRPAQEGYHVCRAEG